VQRREAATAPAPEAARPSERSVCETLSSGADLHVEDVQGGVSVLALPKGDTNLAELLDDARRLVDLSHEPASATVEGEACGLIALGRLPGVRTTVNQGATSVRIIMTTQNPSEVGDLRSQVREQLSDLANTPPQRP
jgi:hypothetical protein